MKIGILFLNENIADRDISQPQKGNPGLGGTEWQRLLLGIYLAKKHNVYFYMTRRQKLPEQVHHVIIADEYEAIDQANRDAMDIMILGGGGSGCLAGLHRTNLKVICILDLIPDRKSMVQLINCTNIVACVCLGRWSYQAVDDALKPKCRIIRHMLTTELFDDKTVLPHKKENIVMFQGAIMPQKGLHVLASVWKYIKWFVPDAKLEIIGSGALYGDNFSLGSLGIAEERYEKELGKYLVDQKTGTIRSDVKFWGAKSGTEKSNIVKHAKVGIMNPSGQTETWGLSASEFECMGIPVVTADKFGCQDSVKNFCGGFRFHTKCGMVLEIILLLKLNRLNSLVGQRGRKRTRHILNPDTAAKEWDALFKAIGGVN